MAFAGREGDNFKVGIYLGQGGGRGERRLHYWVVIANGGGTWIGTQGEKKGWRINVIFELSENKAIVRNVGMEHIGLDFGDEELIANGDG
jgi:hypothetical protein